jgi:hypothetical protein
MKVELANHDDRVSEQPEAALLQGLDSGEPIETDDEWWSRKRAELTPWFGEERNSK